MPALVVPRPSSGNEPSAFNAAAEYNPVDASTNSALKAAALATERSIRECGGSSISFRDFFFCLKRD